MAKAGRRITLHLVLNLVIISIFATLVAHRAIASPLLSDIALPVNPQVSDFLKVTIKSTNASQVTLFYRVMFGVEQVVTMVDDGTGQDEMAGDHIYSASIPPQVDGTLIRVRFESLDSEGITKLPSEDDTMPTRGFVVGASNSGDLPVFRWYIEPSVFEDLITNHLQDDAYVPTVVALGNQVFDNAKVRVKGESEVGSDGSGMGQYFLGAVNTTNGVDLNAIITVPDGLDITNKKISATTTAIDSSSSSGFGSTSVFSQPVEIAQENTPPVTPPSSNTANLTTPTSPISAFSLKPVSISTPTGTNISSSSTVPESSLVTQDNDNHYPLGLVNFSFTTNQSSNQVSLSFITNLKPNQVTPKKYNPSTNTYINLPASSNPTITETTINNQHALVLTYTLIDNGELDLNPTAGTISDPVGLAVSNSTYDQLADTGENTQPILLTAVLLLVSGIVGVWYFGKGRVK